MTRLLAGACALMLVLAACGGGDGAVQKPAPRIATTPKDLLPSELVGLRVAAEDVGKVLKKVRPSYVEAAGLYTLRSGDDQLQATLQVSKLRAGEYYQSNEFRRTIVSRFGGSAPRATRMGKMTVWRTTATKQRVAVWFKGRYFFLLSIRDEFRRSRDLLRLSMELF